MVWLLFLRIWVTKKIMELLKGKKKTGFAMPQHFYITFALFFFNRMHWPRISFFALYQYSHVKKINKSNWSSYYIPKYYVTNTSIFPPRERWNWIHLGLWFAKYVHCDRWGHKFIANFFCNENIEVGITSNYSLVTTSI